MHNFQSRIQHLSSFDTEIATVFLKREDELGFGVSGCKRRKYASLIPFLQAEKFEQVYIIGGENSNNLVGLAQVLTEIKMPFLAFIKAQKNQQKRGNSFLLHLLTKPEQRIYVPTENWENVEEIAQKAAFDSTQKTYIIPEGASCTPCIEGLCGLMLDIQRNEQENKLFFDHIFIDAGTSYTAAVLVAMSLFLQRKTKIHIVHVAGNEALFREQFQKVKDYFFSQKKIINLDYEHFTYHYLPITARSFGSVNATVKQAIIDFAQTEGILTDPIYSAKLLLTAKNIIKTEHLTGNILIIHSGGGTGLMGFDF